MTAHYFTQSIHTFQLTKDNPHNQYNFVAKPDFSQNSTREFSQLITSVILACPESRTQEEKEFDTECSASSRITSMTILRGGEIQC